MAIFRPGPRHRGIKCRYGRQKSRFWADTWFSRMLWTIAMPNAIRWAATDHGKLTTLVAGKWWRLLMAGDDDEVYDEKPQCYTEDSRAAFNCMQWLIWSLSINNKRRHSTYRTAEANYRQTRSIARPFCHSRATRYLYLLHAEEMQLSPIINCLIQAGAYLEGGRTGAHPPKLSKH